MSRENNFSMILEQLNDLSENQKREIISVLNKSLIRNEIFKDLDKEELTEKRFSHDKKCPHCGETHVVKNGIHNGRQRFLCKGCDKTFGETTNTIMYSSKYGLETWILFARCLIRGFSLDKCEEEVGISHRTAFFWRHKILFAISTILDNDKLDGIVEADETYFLESFKGQKGIDWTKMGRTPYHRGGTATQRGISNEQICAICSLDRTGNVLSRKTGRGRPTNTDVEKFFSGHMNPDSILCTDEHNAYKLFARKNNVQIKQIPSGKHKIGLYHIQHVNSYHSHLKGWMARFKGVSTKYLNNYLNWYKWLALRKGVRERDNSQQIIATSYMVDYTIRWSDFQLITESFA